MEQLNIKAKNFRDLLTDEPFCRQDIITLQVGVPAPLCPASSLPAWPSRAPPGRVSPWASAQAAAAVWGFRLPAGATPDSSLRLERLQVEAALFQA